MKKPDPKGRVCLVTTTLYNFHTNEIDCLRYRLACEFLKTAADAKYRVALVDASSSPSIGTALQNLGALVYRQQRFGMGSQRREAMLHAAFSGERVRPSVLLWTEPEKSGIVRHVRAITEPILAGEADIVIPKRKSLSSYPAFQAASETEANGIYRAATDLDADPMFGPVALSREVLHLILFDPLRYDIPDTYVQQYWPIIGLAEGLRVQTVEVDFTYPPEQRLAEETHGPMRAKRLDQYRALSSAYRILAKRLGLPKQA